MDNLQQVINDMLKESQDQRKASSQFSLDDLINRLEELPQDMPILLGEAESYRGYYMDLAFVPLYDTEPRTVKEALKEALLAHGKTFTGYKGGEFTMEGDTPVWYSHYGDCGPAIIGITDEGEILIQYDE
tara:strand:- start:70 stop:459 length:390 start_codon:yes stop_codon:yes gene_type:complete